ncbi:hypothetical protein A0J61_05994 [Choanephora cucurbitarum]|uniref:Choice-of-anchor A domain-containing protein n=1 Tax=Choanephora cucurbitarum TaxID=101091 RepID=A0A1C7NB26_9FUNG|nr:hypothetical protein A0J61_05994 [Choanephora cucurbitarum]
MLLRFNGVFFGDYRAGKFSGSEGPLAVGGSFRGEHAMINRRQQAHPCDRDDHEFVLNGTNDSPHVKVHGHAFIQYPGQQVDSCSREKEVGKHRYDFKQVQSAALAISNKLAGMFPSWTIDSKGVIVRLATEGVRLRQPYHLFTLPAVCQGQCELEELSFECHLNDDCKIPKEALSHVALDMLLGKGAWTGPVEQTYPQDRLIVFNIPVVDGQTVNIMTDNPSAGLNACNTVYHFYAVDQKGQFARKGQFVIRRNSKYPFSGMILAPQAHIVDSNIGSFAGQIIAQSYEAQADHVQIKDYIAAGDEKCQTFYPDCVPDEFTD